MDRGLLFAFMAVTLWGLLDASSRYAVVALHADPMVFSCLNLICGAMILLAIAGREPGGLETIRRPHTWAFGFFRVLMTLFLVFAFTAISASEVNFLLRINVVVTLVAAWVLFHRRPHATDIPGLLLLLGGFVHLGASQTNGFLNWAVLFVILAACCDMVLSVIAERHPVSKKALGLHARCRYTGFVLLVTSLFFFLMALGLALLKMQLYGTFLYTGTLAQVLDRAPQPDAFIDPATLLSALVIGLFLRAPSMYLYLYAARLLKAENLMMAATLAPFATLAAESLFGAMGWLDVSGLEMSDIIAGACMTVGALSMVVLRAAKQGANR